MEDKAEVMSAVQAGDATKVHELLAGNPSLAAARDATGVSALMHAIYRRHQEIADLLVASHPSLDVFESTSTGKVETLKKLLETDPSLAKSYSADGFTALHFAAFLSQPAAASLLLSYGAVVTAVANNPSQVMPLHSAAAGRSAEVVAILLEHGAPVNALQQHGWTPLHSAAQSNDQKTARLLMQHGADPNAANEGGVSPLQLAREKGHNEIATLLSEIPHPN